MKFTPYSTLTEALHEFRKKGFTHSFKMAGKALECIETGKTYHPEDLLIIKYFRFEGISNPSDMSIVYAVRCNDGAKGTVISSYGTYADRTLSTFMDKVKIEDRTEVAGG